ncbi:MAG: metallophosphoesterase [Candidatus Thermoplasmatota archaeon]|jgi:diadenosine tetraphosphatase ApaH/serine/threonine PP2A family protein phosphatase|nr:metallophosphoesterase [Candidatus Thermoplasmatota archaeon]MDP7264333.1 metallophosphoesterase [Candidatus Thermoplasmatota archaeon]
MASEQEKNAEEESDSKKDKESSSPPQEVVENSYPINYMTEEDPEARAEALKARQHIEVEETFTPGKPFFTPDVINDFILNPTYLDKFDSFLTMQLLIAVSDLFESEDNLIKLDSGSAVFVGDIHGDFQVVEKILTRFTDNEKIVFLGNYVDHGFDSLKVVNRLFLEKLRSSERIILLRGNHETLPVNYNFGFLDEIKDKFLPQHVEKIFNWYNEIFSLLPLAAIHDNSTLAIHGGLPRGLAKLHEIDMIGANTPLTEDDVLFELLWNGPMDELTGYKPSPLGERVRLFGQMVFDEFMAENGLERMIVSHGFLENGFCYFFNEKLLKIFSAANYLDEGNKGACAVMDADGKIIVEEV